MFLGLHNGVGQEKIYTSDLGKFSIEYKGEVRENTKQNESSTVYRASYRDQEMLFVISSTVQQNEIINADALLKASLKIFKEAVKGEMIREKTITENNTNGIYAALHLKENDLNVEYKVFSKGLYLYQLMVFAKSDKYNQDLAQTYFKSFKMIE